MFEIKNVKITKEKNTNYYRIFNKDFFISRSENTMSIDEFLDLANRTFIERFGFEPVYTSRVVHTRSNDPVDPYMRLIRSRWASINQRCINGVYNSSESVIKNYQQKSYHKKGIKLEMTKDEFIAWMMSVKDLHDEIIKNGDKSSINRIDSRKGYSIDNLELISLHRNLEEKFGFNCKYLTEQELLEASAKNHERYLKSQGEN